MNNKANNSRTNGPNRPQTPQPTNNGRTVSRGAALRAQKRSQADAQRIANQYVSATPNASSQPRRANIVVDDFEKLKITFLGGQEGIGEKNMQVIEWQNSAIVLDCGNHLGIDLPGINYMVADPTYLDSIKHKLKGYVISHGHLDHLV